MGFPKIDFHVCETRHCPLFRYGDVFQVSGIAVYMESNGENSFINTSVVHTPPGRGNCKILNGDLTRIIIEYERADQIPDCMISCSGCTGSIRLEHFRAAANEGMAEDASSQLGKIIHLLSNFAFFRNIDQNNLSNVLKYFKLKDFKKNQIIIRKGCGCVPLLHALFLLRIGLIPGQAVGLGK